MAIFESGLWAFLTGSPVLIPALGSRYYVVKAPEGAVSPYVVLTRVNPDPIHSHTGPSGLIRHTYQFATWGESQDAVLEAADALRRVLDGYSGPMGSYTVASVVWRTGRPLYEQGSRWFGYADDFVISYDDI